MFVFDRKKFFEGYRIRFGPLTQDLVDAFEVLLSQIEQDNRFPGSETDRRKLAYCLATFKWETAHTMKPIDENGGPKYFNGRYGPQTKVGKMLGNTRDGTLTGVDLLSDPDRAKDPAVAYEIAIQGMIDGWFTTRKLAQFIKDGEPPDYENARTIINGHDKASNIADIARRFNEVLVSAVQ